MDIETVRRIVADMLEHTGHGNPLFITDVREGRQDDGPFMRAACAVRDAYDAQLYLPRADEDLDG